jgi:DNA-binding transcriptional ArsR family regulator
MSNNATKNIDEFAEVFKALSNPHRLKIFLRLVSCCKPGTVSYVDAESSAYVGQLGEDLGVVKSTVSHHIKELKRVGIIRTERQGQNIACWVDPGIVEALKDFFTR